MKKSPKNRALQAEYVSPNQLSLAGFETPFQRELDPENRWVILAHLLPWDELSSVYLKHIPKQSTGRRALNPRIILGSIIIKHMCNLDDRETVEQISENIYMQYFLGYPSFTSRQPFDASLFVEIRKKLGLEALSKINERVAMIKRGYEDKQSKKKDDDQGDNQPPKHKGSLIIDATACPQNIAYPTDLDLLNDAREKSEGIIDFLYGLSSMDKKPRTYRKIARKDYLRTAQKKQKSKKEIRQSVKKQLGYLSRNIRSIHTLLDQTGLTFLDKTQYKYLLVVQCLYDQQKEMFDERKHTVADRIVSIHQPHVRPMVRGKAQSKVEFGSKINVSLANGLTFIDDFSWDAFNEGTRLKASVEEYKRRFGYYPKEVLVDKIYCTRENRAYLKEKGICLKAKPLGRPSKSALSNQVRPGERNPIEGKFGQGKTAYGMDNIKARLAQTSESWVASIVLVLNLIHLAEVAALWNLVLKMIHQLYSEFFDPRENELVEFNVA